MRKKPQRFHIAMGKAFTLKLFDQHDQTAFAQAVDAANRTLRQKARRGATQALRLLGDDYPEAAGLLERLAV